uniref:ASPSCR1 tether for SLC2A4, UBX domain containing n=1 Tax=Bubo bubo TaxID=30461 RepID=A0A8C0FVS2_BUBBB
PRHCVMASPRSVLEAALDRSVLDLSLQWRFARLPNNAKLEMVPDRLSHARERPVRIALQLDDGSRLQDTFHFGFTFLLIFFFFPPDPIFLASFLSYIPHLLLVTLLHLNLLLTCAGAVPLVLCKCCC